VLQATKRAIEDKKTRLQVVAFVSIFSKFPSNVQSEITEETIHCGT
jgi:hypothetical protein